MIMGNERWLRNTTFLTVVPGTKGLLLARTFLVLTVQRLPKGDVRKIMLAAKPYPTSERGDIGAQKSEQKTFMLAGGET